MSLSSFYERKELIIQLGRLMDTLHHPDVYGAAKEENPWFTPESIDLALNAWEQALSKEKIDDWIAHYPGLATDRPAADVLVVMAGNLPLVGLHDLLCSFITGHRTWIKLSSKDQVLLDLLLKKLQKEYSDLSQWIIRTTEPPPSPDAIIASGSNETKAYFSSVYEHKPAILRGHRNSVAILSGHETEEQLMALRHDILSYHGLGCRNVTLILSPAYQMIEHLTELHKNMPPVKLYSGYLNNLRQQMIIAQMNRQVLVHGGQYIIMNSPSLNTPVGVINYQLYEQESDIHRFLRAHKDQIQCCISDKPYNLIPQVPFGQSQYPLLDDYADHIDTIGFLMKINPA